MNKDIQKFIRKVPGFRSGEKVNKIVASAYYSIFIVITIACICMKYFKGAAIFGQWIILPCFIFNIADTMNDSL